MRAWTPGRRSAGEGWSGQEGVACGEGAAAGVAAAQTQALLRTVETEIIPRLMLLHRERSRELASLWASEAGAAIDAETVEHFTTELLAGSAQALAALQQIGEQGVPAPRLCLELLAPSARRLGELWSADLCDFTQVTIALGRLQTLVHHVTRGMHLWQVPPLAPPSVVFAAAPGEQHRLGLSMVRDFFRAAGWEVDPESPERPDALLALVRRRRFDIVGFSIGSERHVKELSTLIAEVRRTSLNRRVRVMVGGPLLLQHSELVDGLGADATADDASRAILVAHELVAKQD